MLHPVAYLTVEIKNREFDSRLMIASHLLDAGLAVAVGQQWSLFENIAALPPGIVLFKTVNKIQAHNMVNFYRGRHIVTATDEEVLLCADDVGFCGGFSSIAADHCHAFYAQSDAHKSAIENRFPQMRGKVIVTGNPRVDATSREGRLVYQEDANKIRQEVGPFILCNSNFCTINSIWGSDLSVLAGIQIRAGVLDPKNPESVRVFNTNLEWEMKNQDELIALLQWTVQNVTSHKIVIRPHPGERIEPWQNLFGSAPNVLIVPRSPHMPWIMAADLLMHTSCTTGLEAALLETPVLNLTPRPDLMWPPRITSLVNACFSSWTDAAPAIQELFARNSGPLANLDKYGPALATHFPNYLEGNSARNMAREMLAALAGRGIKPDPSYQWMPAFSAFKRIPRNPIQSDKMTAGINEVVDGINGMRGRTGLRRPIRVAKLDDSLFMLTAA